jgi:hypothetical protein
MNNIVRSNLKKGKLHGKPRNAAKTAATLTKHHYGYNCDSAAHAEQLPLDEATEAPSHTCRRTSMNKFQRTHK